MILKAHERARASELASYLLDDEDNDHVEIHEIKGFVARDVRGALEEGQALSRGSRCDNFLFSTSLSPPEDKRVTPDDFEFAVGRMEETLSLQGQPRILLFHERNARRHAHCVWSRILPGPMTAVNLSWFRYKLSALSRELYSHFGWSVPAGFLKRSEGDPLLFTREQFEQAKQFGRDPRDLKAALLGAWEGSSSSRGFAERLDGQGLALCRGTRGGYVVVDQSGGVYGLSHWLPFQRQELKAKLGELRSLPSIVEGKARFSATAIAGGGKSNFKKKWRLKDEVAIGSGPHRKMVLRHRQERAALRDFQARRLILETRARSSQLPTEDGLSKAQADGLWAALQAQYEAQWLAGRRRDRNEAQDLIEGQLAELRRLHRKDRRTRTTMRGALRGGCKAAAGLSAGGHAAIEGPVPSLGGAGAKKSSSSKKGDGRKGRGSGGGGGFERRAHVRGLLAASLVPLWHKVKMELTLRPADRRKVDRTVLRSAPAISETPSPRVPIDRRVRRDFVPQSRRG